MKITQYCEIKDINWNSLPDLNARLSSLGVKVDSISVELSRYPNTYEFDSFETAAAHIKESGIPKSYDIYVNGTYKNKTFTLTVARLTTIHKELILYVEAEGLDVQALLDSVVDFFALKADILSPPPIILPRTAVIGYRFDDTGVAIADKLTHFLELLDFRVLTGRSFSPKSISEKVRAMVDKQHLLFVILTPGSDDTWLTQESIGSPKGRVPRACTWVNVKGKYSFRFSNYFYPALGQAKLES